MLAPPGDLLPQPYTEFAAGAGRGMAAFAARSGTDGTALGEPVDEMMSLFR